MPGIYISFARSDKAVTEYIARDLRQRGAEVYWDYQDILPGEDFIGRLGQEIARRPIFILLLSPDAVASRWLRAEVAWAIYCKCTIVPVLLDATTSLTNFLFLYDVQKVDFTIWSRDKTQVDGALDELARVLSLPTEKPYLPFYGADGEEPTEIILNATNMQVLFELAGSMEGKTSEAAYFIYDLLNQLKPEAANEDVSRFLAVQAPRIRAQWTEKLRQRMLKAFQEGQWQSARLIANRILEIQPEHPHAKSVISQVDINQEWEPIYQQALRLANAGQWTAARHLLASIKHACPTFGDPQGLLVLQPASIAVLYQLQTLKTENKQLAVIALAFSSDSREIAAAYTDSSIRLWDFRTGTETLAFDSGTGNISSLVFSSGERVLFSASTNGEDHGAVQMWRISAEDIQEDWMPVNNSTSMAVSLSPNQAYLAAAVEDYASFADFIRGKRNCIRVWTTHNRKQWMMVKDTSGASRHTEFVVFSPDSKFLASDMGQSTIRIWDMAARERSDVPFELQGHTDSVMSAAFSRDSRWLVTGSVDRTVRLWFLGGETVESEILTVEKFPITKVALSPDNRLLLVSLDGISIHIWDLEQRKRLLDLSAHNGTINGLAFSPDGTCFASASADGTIKVWGLV